MNKSELVDRIAARTGLTRNDAAGTVDVVLDAIAEGLIEDGRVKITGFGSFVRRHRNARDGTKPSTGEPITIPASETCGFKAAPALRERLTLGVEESGPAGPDNPPAPTSPESPQGPSKPSGLAGQVEPKPPQRQTVR